MVLDGYMPAHDMAGYTPNERIEMKAIGFYKPGDASVLQWVDLPKPQPGERDLLVLVEAVSVNPNRLQVPRFD